MHVLYKRIVNNYELWSPVFLTQGEQSLKCKKEKTEITSKKAGSKETRGLSSIKRHIEEMLTIEQLF